MGEEKLQHSDQRGGTLAIDLGSTTTVVAYQGATSTTADLLNLPAICSRAGEIPSLVWEASQRPLIGRQVLESGLNDSVDSRLHRDFKGRIGQADAPEQDAARWAGEQLLQQIWSRLPSDLPVERLVLTAPVECYRAYRSWLLQACTTLPVAEIALVDEPTAAAMGAGLPAGSTLLVVDLGGSTLDLALVALEGGEGRAAPIAQLLRLGGRSLGDNSRQMLRTAKVLGKAGLRLGGRDIDRWIVDRCCPGQPASTPLLNAAERLKCRLSDTALAEREPLMELAVDEQEHVLRLSRSELNALLLERGFGDALEQLLETCLAGGRRNNCSLEDLEGVVAVGGGAQLPLLRQWLSEHTAPRALAHPATGGGRGPGCASTHARGRHSGCAATRRFPAFLGSAQQQPPLASPLRGRSTLAEPSPPGAGAGRQPDRPTQLGAGAGGAHPPGEPQRGLHRWFADPAGADRRGGLPSALARHRAGAASGSRRRAGRRLPAAALEH